MSFAHLHVVLNHGPIIAIPLALVFLLHGFWRGNETSRNFALWILVIAAASALPAYFTGEPAEDVVKQLPDYVKGIIHPHEESAEVSTVFAVLTGVAALLALFLGRKSPDKQRKVLILVILLAAISAGSLAYTGYLGGLIRHSEFRTAP